VKHYPGLRDFVKHTAKQYNSSHLQVIQRVCDPFVQFFRHRDAQELAEAFGFTDPATAPEGLSREQLGEVPIHSSDSEEDIVTLLENWGIHMTHGPTGGLAEVLPEG
jgi:hypothetical protein